MVGVVGVVGVVVVVVVVDVVVVEVTMVKDVGLLDPKVWALRQLYILLAMMVFLKMFFYNKTIIKVAPAILGERELFAYLT